jgi:hypothetical protein
MQGKDDLPPAVKFDRVAKYNAPDGDVFHTQLLAPYDGTADKIALEYYITCLKGVSKISNTEA